MIPSVSLSLNDQTHATFSHPPLSPLFFVFFSFFLLFLFILLFPLFLFLCLLLNSWSTGRWRQSHHGGSASGFPLPPYLSLPPSSLSSFSLTFSYSQNGLPLTNVSSIIPILLVIHPEYTFFKEIQFPLHDLLYSVAEAQLPL